MIQDELAISGAAIDLALRYPDPSQGRIHIILWQHGLLDLDELGQTFEWRTSKKLIWLPVRENRKNWQHIVNVCQLRCSNSAKIVFISTLMSEIRLWGNLRVVDHQGEFIYSQFR
ncbi:DUF2949 domain-containing protein [Acaryochloris marina]|uniref:Uncharacterized protein n=1 Tax=Acaryochloris marina (strain MBIC 11017) TaxID=329726 RepID=A8ZL06_ACAM1|nr:DUF2949 domain-containing protein [Acaryochloris marina]ABW31474.1 hypothetical protein AM1_A0356 [Acaryochloris marina MBIC11017]